MFQLEEPSNQNDAAENDGHGTPHAKGKGKKKEHGAFSDNNSDDETQIGANDFHLEMIQGMLNDLKTCLDLPVNFKPRINNETKMTRDSRGKTQQVPRNEEYFLEHCQ